MPDTSVGDTASALEAPETFLGEVGTVFTDVAVTAWYACAATASGRVFCWRESEFGRPCTQPPRSLRSADVTMPETAHPCALDATHHGAACWDWESGLATVLDSGPFRSVHGSCGLILDGSISCWEPFTQCPAPPPSGTFIALDARGSGSAVSDDGSMQLWGFACLERDDVGCTVCADRATLPGPFTLTSNAFGGGGCGLLATGGVDCELTDPVLEQDAPSAASLIDLDVYGFGTSPGACALDEAGLATCWADAAGDAPSTPFVQLEAGGRDGFYGRDADGVIEQFGASYQWVACDSPP